MKKVLLTIIALFCYCLPAMADNIITLAEAERIAKTYYNSIQLIISDPLGDGFINGKRGIYQAFGKDQNGLSKEGEMNIPNDICAMIGQHCTDRRVANYITDISSAAQTYKLQFKYSIEKCDYIYGAVMKNGDKNNTPQFARIIVSKQVSAPQLQTLKITDTMYINVASQGIAMLSNKYRTNRSVNNMQTYDEKKAAATSLYEQGSYDEAYQMFTQVLKLKTDDNDIAYQLGVMTFKGQGCKQYSKKVRDYMCMFYWMKSKKGQELLKQYFGIEIPCNYYTNYDVKRLLWQRGHGDWIWDQDLVTILERTYTTQTAPIGKKDYKPFVSNRMIVYDNNTKKFGYINANGKMVIPAIYSMAYPFCEKGYTYVQTEDNQWLLIDTLGNIELNEISYVIPSPDGTFFAIADKSVGFTIVDRKTGTQKYFFSFTDGLVTITRIKFYDNNFDGEPLLICQRNGKEEWGLFNKNGIELLPCRYKNIHIFNWDFQKAQIVVNYDEAEKQKIETYHDGNIYNRNYNARYDSKTWEKIGEVITINLTE